MTDTATSLRDRAVQSYRDDPRFGRLVHSIVAKVLQEHGEIDRDRPERDAHRIAIDVAAQVLQAIYENDAEIHALRHERDAHKKLALESLSLKTPPILASMEGKGEP